MNQDDPRPITWTRISGTIANGGQAQTLACGNGPLRGFYIQNPSTTTAESLYLEPNPATNGVAVVGGSMEITSGASSLTFGPGTIFAGNTVSLIANTTGHAFIAYYGQ